MGETQRTYLQRKAEYDKSGWTEGYAGPFSVRRFFLENSRRITERTLILEIGTEYRGRIIRDVAFERRASETRTFYYCECKKCGTKSWISEYTARRIPEEHCYHCAPRSGDNLKSFAPRYPDYEPGTRVEGTTLTVIRSERRPCRSGKSLARFVLVQCDCGAEPSWVLFSNLHSGKTTRCNACAKKKARSTQDKKYWGYVDICPDLSHRRRLLARIAACIERCRNPSNANYKSYGGRGIECKFKTRAEFLKYIMSLPGWDNPDLDLDRIDNNGNYEPGNLRWATRVQNVANRRSVSDMQQRINELEAEVAELRERLRLAGCRA